MNKKYVEENENFDDLSENFEIIDDLDLDVVDVEVDVVIEEDSEFDVMFKHNANKHKLEGTHALKRDTIFMGKIEEITEEDCYKSYCEIDNEKYDIERGSSYEKESRRNDEYLHNQNLQKDIYEILDQKTDINFTQNRRKPNKITFNNYYKLCIDNLNIKYSKSEIFVELSYYFTDNIFNMFKLLNKKHATGIITELKNTGYLSDISSYKFL